MKIKLIVFLSLNLLVCFLLIPIISKKHIYGEQINLQLENEENIKTLNDSFEVQQNLETVVSELNDKKDTINELKKNDLTSNIELIEEYKVLSNEYTVAIIDAVENKETVETNFNITATLKNPSTLDETNDIVQLNNLENLVLEIQYKDDNHDIFTAFVINDDSINLEDCLQVITDENNLNFEGVVALSASVDIGTLKKINDNNEIYIVDTTKNNISISESKITNDIKEYNYPESMAYELTN